MIVEQYLETGFNYRLTDIQAALGLVQITRLDALVAQRRGLAARYQELLAGMPGLRAVRDPSYGTTNYQAFWVLFTDDVPADRNDVLARLARIVTVLKQAALTAVAAR